MTVSIVPIAEEHIEGFHAALDVVSREKKYLTFTEAPPIDSTRGFVRGNIETAQTQLVVLDDSKVVGWCDIISSSRATMKHIGVLGTGILPEYRGKGIGRKLLSTAIRQAQEKGLTRIELTVNADNLNAIALYRNLGFKDEGVKRNGFFLDGAYKDILMMAIIS